MEIKKFYKINRIVALVVFLIASYTYLATIEPTASFWDCGEFIASSYKLEVGHPPGNPTFQIIARIFTILGDKDHAAILVNAMSALCSALTILLLYLTIVHLTRRIMEKARAGRENAPSLVEFSLPDAIKIMGAGVVGALAYCWSDTFWFSAVEGEVYAMSSLATALVVWAMLKWEEQADSPYANRWIVFIAFMMGLSIGVHLLNLLTIPTLGMIYYYKKTKQVTTWGAIKAFIISCVVLAVILWGLIPYIPLLGAHTDRFFVNTLSLPVNSGFVVFMLIVLAACFFGVYRTFKQERPVLNTIYLSIAAIVIGYSLFAVVVERSSVNTPTNEYQPDNPYTLVRYLGREQYGSAPLLYGQTFNSPMVDFKIPAYYNIVDGKYKKLNGPAEPVWGEKRFFPRMYTKGASGEYASFYQMYTEGKGEGEHKIPTMGANLKYFFGYQLNFMYWRYFMWNFVGRQNDLQAQIPGDLYKGNWESGIGFIDRAHLGDQSQGPDYIVNSRAKNHFYFLPLILGVIGLIYQYSKDKRNFAVTFLLFFLTGLATVIYLNQTPYQPRERDYAYAGSFYAFTIWIGFAVVWIAELFEKVIKNKKLAAVIASVLALLVPVQMVSQTWDDHDRSGRYTCRDLAYNYLAPLQKNAILVTHGDNDTFPLWYIQEVEGFRTDVRVVNTSLLGTDWYIDQMKCKQYESEPLDITIPRELYLYGTNDFVPVYEIVEEAIPAKAVINAFKDPSLRVRLSDNQMHNIIAARKMTIPVDKENVKKYGIVSEKDYDKILDTVELVIPEKVSSLSKTDLIILDVLAGYKWDRPVYFLQKGGEVNIGEKEYLQYDGIAYKFVPIRSSAGTNGDAIEQCDADSLYNNFMNVYRWDSLADDMNVDYQNLITFNALVIVREVAANTAAALVEEGKKEKAVEVIDRLQKVMPDKNFPLNSSLIASSNDLAVINLVNIYLECGEKEKAVDLADRFIKETLEHLELFAKPFDGELYASDYAGRNLYYMIALADVYRSHGMVAEAQDLRSRANNYMKLFYGHAYKGDLEEAEEQDTAEI